MKPKVLFLLSGEQSLTVLEWLVDTRSPFMRYLPSGEHPFQVALEKTTSPAGWEGSVVHVSTCPRTGLPSAELMVDAKQLKRSKVTALLEGLARLEVGLITARNNGVMV